ncbi:hypothetical protein ACQP2U_43550 (plasmid) [Nocardia sp. CA-084685]|uniref:hypothetical protein n=1 Tax=Nocardia sp. CA-084685 TaxID=3239970 RepID=UPI003D96F726
MATAKRADIALVGPTGALEILKPRVPQRKIPALLASGLLGPRYHHSAGLLVERDQVERAAALPDTDITHLHTQVGQVFVTRQTCRTPVTGDPTRQWMGVDVFAPLPEQLAATEAWYTIGAQTRAAMRARIHHNGFIPLVSTVSGLVGLCRDIIEVPTEPGLVRFTTRPAGTWSDLVTNHWLPTRQGGPWTWT